MRKFSRSGDRDGHFPMRVLVVSFSFSAVSVFVCVLIFLYIFFLLISVTNVYWICCGCILLHALDNFLVLNAKQSNLINLPSPEWPGRVLQITFSFASVCLDKLEFVQFVVQKFAAIYFFLLFFFFPSSFARYCYFLLMGIVLVV